MPKLGSLTSSHAWPPTVYAGDKCDKKGFSWERSVHIMSLACKKHDLFVYFFFFGIKWADQLSRFSSQSTVLFEMSTLTRTRPSAYIYTIGQKSPRMSLQATCVFLFVLFCWEIHIYLHNRCFFQHVHSDLSNWQTARVIYDWGEFVGSKDVSFVILCIGGIN